MGQAGRDRRIEVGEAEEGLMARRARIHRSTSRTPASTLALSRGVLSPQAHLSRSISLILRLVTRSAGIGTSSTMKLEKTRYRRLRRPCVAEGSEGDGGRPPSLIPTDVGHQFRGGSKKWPASGRNQWPRSTGMGGRLASESVAGLGRNSHTSMAQGNVVMPRDAEGMKTLNLRDYVSDEFDFGEFPPGALIVDIGCGTGKQLQLLELRGCAPIGIELDRNHVKRCGKERLKVIQGIAEQIALKQASCDGVICKVVIPYTNEAMSLLEIGRILKPGGIGRICYHGAGYYLQYVLRAVSWKYRIYGVRAFVNTWHYAMTGRRLPSFLGDTLYQSKARLNKYYCRYGLELLREEQSREFLSFPVFIYHSIRKLRR